MRTTSPFGVSSTRPTIRPAARAPSTKSKPTSFASQTSAARASTDRRTAAWPVVWIGVAQDAEDRRRPGARDHHGAAGDDEAEHDEQDRLGRGAVDAGEEDRDHDDRPELSCDARPQHGAAERRRQQAGVGEHRDERPERGRGQRDADQPALGVEAAGVQREPDRRSRARASRPSRACRAAAPAAARASRPPRSRRRRRGTRARSSRGTSMYWSACAQSSTCGPIRIPSTISTTTVGSTTRWWIRDRIAPSVDAASTRTSDWASSAGGAAASRGGARSCAGESMTCRDRGRRDAEMHRERPR